MQFPKPNLKELMSDLNSSMVPLAKNAQIAKSISIATPPDISEETKEHLKNALKQMGEGSFIMHVAPLCPNCSAEWSHAELQQQECFTCGHPDPWDAITDDDKFD